MKGLKCTTANCEYNQACHCTAGIITVSEHAICKTKLKRKYGVMEQEFANLEAAQEFDYEDSEELLIECDSTECMYNSNRRCSKEMVEVGDSKLKTRCLSKKNNKCIG